MVLIFFTKMYYHFNLYLDVQRLLWKGFMQKRLFKKPASKSMYRSKLTAGKAKTESIPCRNSKYLDTQKNGTGLEITEGKLCSNDSCQKYPST